MRSGEHSRSRMRTQNLRVFCRGEKRGSIILVLLVSCFLLLVMMALATMSSMNLNLVRSQVEFSQALLTAQAASAQFLYELDEFERSGDGVVDLSSTVFEIPDLKKRYREKPAIPLGAERMAGEAFISFDAAGSVPYFSTDNSLSEFPCKGFRERKVPAFTIELITTVKAGGSTRYFQAFIGRKWPYAAFCSRGPIVITSMGVRLKQQKTCAPSIVNGALFSLYDLQAAKSQCAFGNFGDGFPQEGSPPPSTAPDSGLDSPTFYGELDPARLPLSSICIGAQIQDLNNLVTGDAYTSMKKPQVLYCVKPGQGADPIYVAEGNAFIGRKHYGVSPGCGACNRDPLSYISFPDKTGFTELNPEAIAGIKVMGAPTELNLVEGTLAWAGTLEDLDRLFQAIGECVKGAESDSATVTQPDVSASGASKPVPQSTGAKRLALPPLDPEKVVRKFPELEDDIREIVGQHLEPFQENKEIYEKLVAFIQGSHCFIEDEVRLEGSERGNRFYLKGNLTNHYVLLEYDPDPPVRPRQRSDAGSPPEAPLLPGAVSASGGGEWRIREEKFSRQGLILRNCTLFVDGNVELGEFPLDRSGFIVPTGSAPPRSLSADTPKSIEGNNATLIVSGNMKLIGGMLDCKDNGMVIHARNIEFSTKGDYRGLILSQGAIVINPYPVRTGETSSESNRMHITGAVASRGEVVTENAGDEAGDSPQHGESGTEPPGSARLEGLVLKSVVLDYDPRYVKALHRFGTPRIILWQELH